MLSKMKLEETTMKGLIKRIISVSMALLLAVTVLHGTHLTVYAGYGSGNYKQAPPSGQPVGASFKLNGSAAVDNNYPNTVILTADRLSMRGSVYSTIKLQLSSPFKTEAYIYQGCADGRYGELADGMTFIMHNDPRGNNAQGMDGAALGSYGTNAITNSIAIEFDTYYNGDAIWPSTDPARPGDLSFVSHCAFAFPKATRITSADHIRTQWYRRSETWRQLNIEWTPQYFGSELGGTLSYYFQGTNANSSYTITSVRNTFGSTEVWWGFTGATGAHSSINAVAFKSYPVKKYPVYISYFKDDFGGELLGHIVLELPPGSPITGYSASLYAPSGYITPGAISGDTVAKSPYSLVNVVYKK